MNQEKGASIRTLSPLRGTVPEEFLAQLTCSEFLQLVDQLKKQPRADEADGCSSTHAPHLSGGAWVTHHSSREIP